MKPWHLLIIALVIIFLTPYSFSEYLRCTCLGKCHGRDVEQSVTKLYDLFSMSEEEECLQRAKKAFGGHCGGLADCGSGCVEIPIRFDCGDGVQSSDFCTSTAIPLYCGENCECDFDTLTCWPKVMPVASTCCQDWCSGFSGEPPAYYGCIQSCESICRTNELTNQIISLFRYISVVIAAIMLAINGIKFITSDSPYGRDQAKQSIRYVIIALIILALVTYIATALFFSIQVPGGDTSLGECTSIELGVEDICLEACTEPSCSDINSYISSAISGLSSKSSLMDSNLILAVIKQESGFHQCSGGKVITSSAGAMGLMQLMPDTATWLGVDPCDAEDNVKGGVKYLNFLLQDENYEDYGSPKEITLAAYNCGQGNINKILTEQCIDAGIAKADCTWDGHVKDHIGDYCIESETLPYVSTILGYGTVTCSK